MFDSGALMTTAAAEASIAALVAVEALPATAPQLDSDDITAMEDAPAVADLIAAVEAAGALEDAVSAAEVDALDGDGVLARIAAAQRRVNLAQVEQLALAAHWADLHATLAGQETPGASDNVGRRGRETLVHPGGAGTPGVSEFCRDELAAMLKVSQTSADFLIGDALDLRHRLPMLWARVQGGDVKVFAARAIARKTRHLHPAAAAHVDATVARVVSTLPFGRLEKVLDAAILRADPAQAERDTASAATRQGVWLGRELDHGYGVLFARAAAPDLAAVDATLDVMARAMTVLGDTDSHDVRRAKALGVMADPTAALELTRLAAEALGSDGENAGASTGPHDGADPRRGCDLGRAVVYVHLTQQSLAAAAVDAPRATTEVARVDEVGPVLLAQARDWLRHRQVSLAPVIDIPGMPPVDRYEVPDRMASAIRLRTPADCAPYSANLTGRGDSDHTLAYRPLADGGPPGQTRVANLGWLSRANHRWKTHGSWRVTQPRSGTWLWRSPHRH